MQMGKPSILEIQMDVKKFTKLIMGVSNFFRMDKMPLLR